MITTRKDSLRDYYSRAISEHIDGDERLFAPIDPAINMLIENFVAAEETAAIDLGYGAGNYAITMAQAGLTVTAVDTIPPLLLQQRLANQPELLKRLNIIEADLAAYQPNASYQLAIAKDVLHFLPRTSVVALLSGLIAAAPNGAAHFITMFTDISRYDRTGAHVQIYEEANYSHTEWLNELNQLYSSWQCDIDISDYAQHESADRGGRKYFQAQLIRLISRKP